MGAHCELFFLGDVYERLVGDASGKIEGWVRYDRMALGGYRRRREEAGRKAVLAVVVEWVMLWGKEEGAIGTADFLLL